MIAALKRTIGSLFSRTPPADPERGAESPATLSVPSATPAETIRSTRPEGTDDPVSPTGPTPGGEGADTQEAAGGGARSFG